MTRAALNIPNALSGLRLAAVPALLYLGYTGRAQAFLFLFCAALATDCVDGFLARKLHMVTSAGARLDSIADFAMYAGLAACAWRLWPELIRREAFFVGVAVVGYVTPVLIGVLRFGRLTSFHTWAAKVSAVLMGAGVLLLVATGAAWPFRLAVPVMIAAGIEEIAITLILRKWRADVPSVKHALRIRRELESDAGTPPGSHGVS
ncbi:MAG: CDP-alcohol phosphatidyltransferase family protein [Lentisphaerae bacterium]|nr:CDP-alcohol phosphatidyltransferase family protein [Lentisphaerota bacterium]